MVHYFRKGDGLLNVPSTVDGLKLTVVCGVSVLLTGWVKETHLQIMCSSFSE